MLTAIKNFFGIDTSVWIWDASRLSELPSGTKIIENYGMTEGGPATQWVKNDDGMWESRIQTVSENYFNLPFLVVS